MRRQYLAPQVTPEEALAQLERIKASGPFRSSRRCVLFLDYVVNQAVKGEIEPLKERAIGVEVFGRAPNWDTNRDPVVRGTATEIRKRLAQYYQAPEHEDELRIQLAAESYLPEIYLPSNPPAPGVESIAASSSPDRSSPAPRRARTVRPWIWVSAAVVALAALAVVGLLWNRATTGARAPGAPIDQFWAPVLATSRSILLCVGQPTVYNIVGPLNEAVTKAWTRGSNRRTRESPRVLADIRDIVPSSDRYLALGDAICLSDITAFLARRGRDYRVRGGASTTLADLRGNTSILIGAFNNQWAARLAGPLRFTFEAGAGPESSLYYVRDRNNPKDRRWALKDIWPGWDTPVDYAIVSRIFDPTTNSVVITAAGITHFGTAAAGEFLTNPEYVAQAFERAGKDWPHKNVQAVLATRITGGTAGPPQVLAVDVR